jgi:hypothetical protein
VGDLESELEQLRVEMEQRVREAAEQADRESEERLRRLADRAAKEAEARARAEAAAALSEEATRLQREAEQRAQDANVDELAQRRLAEQAGTNRPAGTHYAGGRRLRTY